MKIFIKAIGEGKNVRVTDKISNKVAFDGFLELADGEVDVSVASRDGEVGLIDIMKGATSPPNTVSRSNYAVKSGEILPISDGQD